MKLSTQSPKLLQVIGKLAFILLVPIALIVGYVIYLYIITVWNY